MSDSREAYVKWRQDRGIRIGDDPIPATEFWDAAWQAAQGQSSKPCPYIATSSEGTSWCRLAAQPQINQQLLEVLGSMGYDLVARNPFTQQRHGAGEQE